MRNTVEKLAPRILLTCAVGAVLAATAHADVVTEERISVNGLMKMVNMSGTTVTTISGDRARTDSNLQFESGMMRMLARGAGESTEIVRLDQDKLYSLDPRKKTYTETTFAEQREQMQQAMQQMQEGQAAQQQSASGIDESQCEWSEPTADIARTGEKATVAGYEAERVTITAKQSCTNRKTGEVCDFGLSLDQWVAPGFEASAETLAYQRAYAQKLGLGASASPTFAERAESMFGRYQGIWTEVAAKMQDVKGYPVKSSFGLGVGGPQCQSAYEQQATDEPGVAQRIGGAVGGALGSALGGMFGRKKKEEAPAQAQTPPAAMPGGLIPLMTVSTELVSVRQEAVDPQLFEIPPGYKKEN